MASEDIARARNRERVAEQYGTNPAPDLTHGERQMMRALALDRIGSDDNIPDFEGGWKDDRVERMWYGPRYDEEYGYDDGVGL